jgi:hypothetical protein
LIPHPSLKPPSSLLSLTPPYFVFSGGHPRYY